MHSIEIDNEAYHELSQRAVGFYLTPNDALRRVLELPDASLADQAEDPPIRRPSDQQAGKATADDGVKVGL